MKHITLNPGEILVITGAPLPPPTPDKPGELDVLLTIGSVNIYTNKDASYVQFTSDLDICNDGCGPPHGDPSYQSQTAYYSGGKEGGKYLNADVDRYIVVPPQVRAFVPGVVMGCYGKVTNLKTKVVQAGVVGEIGPDDKTGECAYCLAKKLNPHIEYNTGDSNKVYLYELYPGVAARDGDFTYKLQPA
jgi:Fungal chitosanase of glycosyl hydrolase group 75